MAVNLDDLVSDWRTARDALQAQLDLMKADPLFPDAAIAQHERSNIRSSIELLIARYDELIIRSGKN